MLIIILGYLNININNINITLLKYFEKTTLWDTLHTVYSLNSNFFLPNRLLGNECRNFMLHIAEIVRVV